MSAAFSPIMIDGALVLPDVSVGIPMHCSSQNFIDLGKAEMPEKLVLCTTRSRFTFST